MTILRQVWKKITTTIIRQFCVRTQTQRHNVFAHYKAFGSVLATPLDHTAPLSWRLHKPSRDFMQPYRRQFVVTHWTRTVSFTNTLLLTYLLKCKASFVCSAACGASVLMKFSAATWSERDAGRIRTVAQSDGVLASGRLPVAGLCDVLPVRTLPGSVTIYPLQMRFPPTPYTMIPSPPYPPKSYHRFRYPVPDNFHNFPPHPAASKT